MSHSPASYIVSVDQCVPSSPVEQLCPGWHLLRLTSCSSNCRPHGTPASCCFLATCVCVMTGPSPQHRVCGHIHCRQCIIPCDLCPISSTPDTILKKLVRPHGRSVFFRLAVGGSRFCPDGEKGVVFYKRPGSSHWNPLLDIASRVSVCLL